MPDDIISDMTCILYVLLIYMYRVCSHLRYHKPAKILLSYFKMIKLPSMATFAFVSSTP